MSVKNAKMDCGIAAKLIGRGLYGAFAAGAEGVTHALVVYGKNS